MGETRGGQELEMTFLRAMTASFLGLELGGDLLEQTIPSHVRAAPITERRFAIGSWRFGSSDVVADGIESEDGEEEADSD